MNVVCKIVTTEEELQQAFAVRKTVFVQEQHVPQELEWDEFEATALHVIGTLDQRVLATGRLRFFDAYTKIERVAVLKPYRRQGIGTQLMQFLMNESCKRGKNHFMAHVQVAVREFYEQLGFIQVSDMFMEAGIEHIKMER